MTASGRIQRAIWPVAVLILAAAIADFVLLALNAGTSGGSPVGQDSLALRVEIPIFGITFGLVGALIASRHSRNPVGWIGSRRSAAHSRSAPGSVREPLSEAAYRARRQKRSGRRR